MPTYQREQVQRNYQPEQVQLNYGNSLGAQNKLDPNSFTYGNVGRTQGVAGLEGIYNQAKGAYGSLLPSAQNYANLLTSNATNLSPQLAQNFNGVNTQAQAFMGQNLNPQMMGQFNYSNSMSPLIQQQLSRAQQNAGLQAQSQANQMTQQLNQAGGNNSALAAALRNRSMAQSQLAQNSLPTQFLAQQANMDTQRYALNQQSAQQNNAAQQAAAQQRVQNYQAGLQGLTYNADNARQNYTTGLQGIQANNQAGVNNLNAQVGAASPINNLFGTVGQQLPSYGQTYQNTLTDQYGLNPQPSQGGK